MNELNFFLEKEVFEQVVTPTEEQMKSALQDHCFKTEKRVGRFKVHAVTDGRSQTRYLEEQSYSPTVRLESIMLCSLIDALEGHEVTTIDNKGALYMKLLQLALREHF